VQLVVVSPIDAHDLSHDGGLLHVTALVLLLVLFLLVLALFRVDFNRRGGSTGHGGRGGSTGHGGRGGGGAGGTPPSAPPLIPPLSLDRLHRGNLVNVNVLPFALDTLFIILLVLVVKFEASHVVVGDSLRPVTHSLRTSRLPAACKWRRRLPTRSFLGDCIESHLAQRA
jgi:hypothetical protein